MEFVTASLRQVGPAGGLDQAKQGPRSLWIGLGNKDTRIITIIIGNRITSSEHQASQCAYEFKLPCGQSI